MLHPASPWLKAVTDAVATGSSVMLEKQFARATRAQARHVLRREGACREWQGLADAVCHFAAYRDALPELRLLIRLGAPLDLGDSRSGRPPVWQAAFGNNLAGLRLLLAHPDARTTINMPDRNGIYGLEFSAELSSPKLIDVLLAAGADPRLGTPLHEAAVGGRRALVKKLVRRGARVRDNFDPVRGHSVPLVLRGMSHRRSRLAMARFLKKLGARWPANDDFWLHL